VRNVRLFRALLGVDQRTVIEDIEFEEAEEQDAGGDTLVVARVRPRSGVSRRCGLCGRRAPWYDRGEGTRRWRGLDWGAVQVVLEAEAPRVNCPTHGPTVVAAPWARHRAGHTLAFDATVAWLAVAASKTTAATATTAPTRWWPGRPAVRAVPAVPAGFEISGTLFRPPRCAAPAPTCSVRGRVGRSGGPGERGVKDPGGHDTQQLLGVPARLNQSVSK